MAHTLTESAIVASMMGAITEADFDLVADIDLRVCHQITCPVSGGLLDSRTAVLVVVDSQKVAVHPSSVDDAVNRIHAADIGHTIDIEGPIPTRVLEVLQGS